MIATLVLYLVMSLCMTTSFRLLKLTFKHHQQNRFLSKTLSTRTLSPYIKSTKSDEYMDESTQESTDTITSYPQLKIGTSINVVITKFGYLGASVDIPEHNLTGLILHKEIDYFVEKRGGKDIDLGETLAAYVQRNREEGKVDVSLRPGVFTRINDVKKLILHSLTDSTSKTILLGDKSSALDVSASFPGVSKTDFRNALGALYRDKLIIPGPRDTSLVSNYTDVLKSIEAIATTSGNDGRIKSRQTRVGKGSNVTYDSTGKIKKVSKGHTLFIGNLSPNSKEEDFRAYLVALFDGSSMIQGIRLAQDERGSSKGFAYVDITNADFLPEAVELVKSVPFRGRKLRCDIDAPTITLPSASSSTSTDKKISKKPTQIVAKVSKVDAVIKSISENMYVSDPTTSVPAAKPKTRSDKDAAVKSIPSRSANPSISKSAPLRESTSRIRKAIPSVDPVVHEAIESPKDVGIEALKEPSIEPKKSIGPKAAVSERAINNAAKLPKNEKPKKTSSNNYDLDDLLD